MNFYLLPRELLELELLFPSNVNLKKFEWLTIKSLDFTFGVNQSADGFMSKLSKTNYLIKENNHVIVTKHSIPIIDNSSSLNKIFNTCNILFDYKFIDTDENYYDEILYIPNDIYNMAMKYKNLLLLDKYRYMVLYEDAICNSVLYVYLKDDTKYYNDSYEIYKNLLIQKIQKLDHDNNKICYRRTGEILTNEDLHNLCNKIKIQKYYESSGLFYFNLN